MVALSKLLSYSHRLLCTFFLQILQLLKLLVLVVYILWKHCKVIKSSYNYRSAINKNSSKFTCSRSNSTTLGECSICLSEFAEGEEAWELLDCKHTFHSRCLERWLMKKHTAATCPMCRTLVVPEFVLAEHRKMQREQEYDVAEKELALTLLNALPKGTCNMDSASTSGLRGV